MIAKDINPRAVHRALRQNLSLYKAHEPHITFSLKEQIIDAKMQGQFIFFRSQKTKLYAHIPRGEHKNKHPQRNF